MNALMRFVTDESGATLVEYVVLVAVIAMAAVVTVYLIGQELNASLDKVKTCIKDTTPANCGG